MFKREDKEIEYTGPSDQNIKVVQGMTQAELNAQFVSILSELKSQLELCKCSSNVKANTDSTLQLSNSVYKSYTGSKCQSDIVNRSVDIIFNNKQYTYNVSQLVDNLPSSFIVESSRCRITKNNSVIANLSGISSGITLSSTELPALAKIEVTLNTPCGTLVLSKSFSLESDFNTTSTLDVQDSGSQYNLKNQSEFNDLIYNRLLSLESKL